MKIITTYIIIASLILHSCSDKKQEVIQPEEEVTSTNIIVEEQQFVSSQFELGAVKNRQFSNHLKVSGEIHLPEKSQAAVSTLLDGRVGAMNWIEGQWVSKGATLFTITNPDLINMQEDFLVLQGQLSYLREENTRQSKLAAEKITTQKDLLKSRSELRSSEARYAGLKKKLDLYGINTSQLNNDNIVVSMQITAPISGYISEINTIRGDYLGSSKTALKIANTNHVHLELSVLEKDAHLLKRGQEIEFTLQNAPSQKHHADIHLVNKSIDENHMVRVHGHIKNEKEIGLIPGMYVNAEILLDEKSMTALPKDAIVKLGNEHFVLRMIQKSNGQYEFEQVEVEVGEELGDFVAVYNLSVGGGEYLTKGAYFLIQ